MIIEIVERGKMLDCLQFVCRAVALESSRYALKMILVDENCFVATDGRRMHIANIKHEYEQGLYRIVQNDKIVVLLKEQDPGRFPEWRNIIPKHKDYFTIDDNKLTDNLDTVAAFALAQKGIACRYNNLHEALGEYGVWDIYFGKPCEPVMCTSDGKQAILMPVNTPPKIEFKVIT